MCGEDSRLRSDMVSFTVRAGVVDHGMIMNVTFGNLGDPVWFLFQERTVNKYGNSRPQIVGRNKIGFNQAGKQQVRDRNPDWEV